MKLLNIRNTLIFILLTASVSCETDADMGNAPPFKQKLIITGFISPSDTASYFDVVSNKKIFGELNTEEPLGPLSGTISDGTATADFIPSGNGLKITCDKMQIKHGSTYQIKIHSSNGLNAESICTVPGKNDFTIEADTFSIRTNYNDYNPNHPDEYYRKTEFRVRFDDVPAEENYYRVFGIVRGYFTYVYQSRISKFISIRYVPFDKEFLSDNGLDGKNIILTTNEKYNNYNDLFSGQCDSMVLKIYLYNTEKSYYLFHKSLADYNDGENPFAESSPVYSNITGGSGIFTSYTVDSLIIKFKKTIIR